MNIYESESMTVVADDGIIHYIIDRNDPHTANYADKRGKTGAHGIKALPLTRSACWITTRIGQNTRAGKQPAARSWKDGY